MRRAGPLVVAGAGTALVLVGVVVFTFANSGPFGGTRHTGSYAPLEPGADAYESELSLTFDGSVLWTWGQAAGAGLVVLGLLVLAALAGWWLGRRGGRARPG